MGKHKMMVWRKDAKAAAPAVEAPAARAPVAPKIETKKTGAPEADAKTAKGGKNEPMEKSAPSQKAKSVQPQMVKAGKKKLKTDSDSPSLESTPKTVTKWTEVRRIEIKIPELPMDEPAEPESPPAFPVASQKQEFTAAQSIEDNDPASGSISVQTSLSSISAERPAAVLEAALFMSGQALSAADLARLVGIAAIGQVQDMLTQLSAAYEKQGSALEVVEETPGKWVMRVRAKLAPSVRHFAGEAEIPKHALRTLSYINKNNGIKKRDLFNRLGSTIYEDVAVLIEKGFLSTTPAGRTVSLKTTAKFKQYFEG